MLGEGFKWTDDGEYFIVGLNYGVKNTTSKIRAYSSDGDVIFTEGPIEGRVWALETFDDKIIAQIQSKGLNIYNKEGRLLKEIAVRGGRIIEAIKNNIGIAIFKPDSCFVFNKNLEVVTKFLNTEGKTYRINKGEISPEGNVVVLSMEKTGVSYTKEDMMANRIIIDKVMVIDKKANVIGEQKINAPFVNINFIEEKKFIVESEKNKYMIEVIEK